MSLVRTLLVAALCLAGCAPPPTVPRTDGNPARLVVDTRPPPAFAAAHRPGALNLQLGWGQLAARIEAYVPDPTTSIALRSSDETEAARAARVLERRGYVDVALAPEGGETAALPVLLAAELRRRLDGADPPVVLDVRSRLERALGSIEGSVFVDEDLAPAGLGDLDPDRSYAVICEGGWRSSQVASWMRREGFERVWNVIDGMAGWRSSASVPR